MLTYLVTYVDISEKILTWPMQYIFFEKSVLLFFLGVYVKHVLQVQKGDVSVSTHPPK